MTNTKLKALCIGILITAIIQSSSAVSVILITLLNSSLISLDSAIMVLIGANIGTCLTAWILTLNVHMLAPFFSIIGVILLVCFHHKTIQIIGEILISFGFIFMGMNMMSSIDYTSSFYKLLSYLNHPFPSLIIGIIITMIIQSSSASIGMLQAICNCIPLYYSAFMIYGINIGTCITAFIASLPTNKTTKKLALFQLFFNIIGTVIFIMITLYTPFVSIINKYIYNKKEAIAIIHTIFNIITALIVVTIINIKRK